jgi:thiol-disulfide isomerase/thioredoxin
VNLRTVAIMLAAGLLALTGCASSPSAPAAAVPDTLNFTGKTLDGATFDASTLAGRPALIWFWAPWCSTCASEAQSINDLKDEYGDRLAIIGIAGMGTNTDMHRFVADLDVTTVPNLDDQAGVLWRRFGVTEHSTYVVIDRSGTVVATGYLDDLQLTDKVKSLVA